MLIKRFVTFIIDILIAIFPVIIVSLKYQYSFKHLLYVTICLYLIHTTIFILTSGKNTIGENIMGIIAKPISNNLKIINKLVLKNFITVFFLFLIILNLPDITTTIIILILFILMTIPTQKEKRTQTPISVLDLVFNIYYVQSTNEPSENK